MGCDIHLFIEYRAKDAEYSTDNFQRRWRSFGGRINPGRWYAMFEKLAGVRGDESSAVVAPRGFPSDAGYSARTANHLYISNSSPDADGHVSREMAEKWVREGSSRFEGDDSSGAVEGEVVVFDGSREHNFITHPDWHSHSWLTPQEYATAIRAVSKPKEAPEYYAVLAAMRQFEAAGFDARAVFWFDN